MKKVIFMGICLVLCLCGCASNQKANFNYENREQIEKEIKVNFTKISEVTDLTSSNPFDYTKNEYYKNIVNLGDEAIPVLEDMYNKGELLGVDAYLSALMIQEITQCNLFEKYNLDWSTADEFYTLWKDNNCSYKK